MRPGGAPPAPLGGAPTIPLRPGAPPAGAATVPLKPTPGAPAGPGATQVLPQATTKLKQTQPLGQLPPPSAPASVGAVKTVEPGAELHKESDTLNIILAALILLTTIFLGMLEYSKSRVAEIKDADINLASPQTAWTDLLGK